MFGNGFTGSAQAAIEQARYALFDFDGVIADTEPLYIELDRAALAALGYEATDDDLESFIGKASEVAGPELLRAHGIEATTEDYLAVWDSDAGIYGREDLEPSPGLRELWERLRERGCRIAVVSTTRCVSLVRALNHFGMLTYVDAIVGREMVTHAKPDPEPYVRGLELLARLEGESVDAARAHAVAFDDSPSGIASAKAAGVFAVCYTGASATLPVEGADAVIDQF